MFYYAPISPLLFIGSYRGYDPLFYRNTTGVVCEGAKKFLFPENTPGYLTLLT